MLLENAGGDKGISKMLKENNKAKNFKMWTYDFNISMGAATDRDINKTEVGTAICFVRNNSSAWSISRL